MKTPLLSFVPALLLLQCLLLLPALATPDRIVQIDEKILGTNAEGYVILRTETDNLGSYYSSNTKRYLDEYAKTADTERFELALGKKIRSTLLLDTKTSIDVDAPNYDKAAHTSIKSKDASVSLADLLEKFHDSPSPWDGESFRKLKISKHNGVDCGAMTVVDQTTINREAFGDRHPDLDWVVDEVAEDMNCLFLTVSKRSPDEISETKILCIPPRRTAQARAHLQLEPLYLISGVHPTLKEAQAQILVLKKKADHAKKFTFSPEIWSISENEKMIYLIAEGNAMEHIRGERFNIRKQTLGVDLFPRTSAGFIECFPIE